MNPDKVVPCEVQAKRSPQILPLLAEAIRQPSQPPNLHPHSEVLALNVRCANTLRIGIADDWDSLRGNDFGGAVACFASDRRAVDLD